MFLKGIPFPKVLHKVTCPKISVQGELILCVLPIDVGPKVVTVTIGELFAKALHTFGEPVLEVSGNISSLVF